MENKTAIDWLLDQLVELDKQLDGRRKNEDATVLKLNIIKIHERAKAIEREQMIDFHNWMRRNDTAENAEQYFHYSDEDMLNEYYNETYDNA